MPALKFMRQNKKVSFDGEILESFIDTFPMKESYFELARALGRYGVSVLGKQELVEKLLYDMRDNEWEMGGREERCRLLNNKYFLNLLSEKQAQLVLGSLDEHFLQALYRSLRLFPRGVLPASPRMSTDTRIKLMLAILAANDPDWAKDVTSVKDAVYRQIAIEEARSLLVEEFPEEIHYKAFQKCYYNEKYIMNPSIALGEAPLEMAITGIIRDCTWKKRDMEYTYEMQVRHGRWERVVLEIEGRPYALSLELLSIICDYCDLEETGAALVAPLFATGHPLILSKIIYAERLSREQADAAWEDGDISVCRKLLETYNFFSNLSDSQAEDIMALNDLHILQNIARRIYIFYSPLDNECGRRLSGRMRDALLAFIAYHQDSEVVRFFDPQGISPQLLESLKPKAEILARPS